VTPLLATASLLIVALGLLQWAFGLFAGTRHSRVLRSEERGKELAIFAGDEPPERPTLFFLVPCLNEEDVIDATLAALLSQDGTSIVVVIDDGSEDSTADRAVSYGPRVEVVSRSLPDARNGKGEALNAGFQRVRSIVATRQLDPSNVVLCVMDADGRLSDGAVDTVLPHFEDPKVGGLQLPVRIRNATSTLTRYQDFEFWGVAAVPQIARASIGSTSLGGNGQFSRLSALLTIGDRPWSNSLTEDLDLAISMMSFGWKLTSTPSAHVSQQGVTEIRRLSVQRTRWMQGQMMAAGRIPELWRSDLVPGKALLEMVGYLLIPWVLVLPWSILFHLGLLAEFKFLFDEQDVELFGSTVLAQLATAVAWYVLSFLPVWVAAWVYKGRSFEPVTFGAALRRAHLFLLFNYVTFQAAWRALARLILGRNNWNKTARVVEPDDRPAPDRSPAIA
jgi:1,2-diacylglycerol 3-beta-glucosyltransferase